MKGAQIMTAAAMLLMAACGTNVVALGTPTPAASEPLSPPPPPPQPPASPVSTSLPGSNAEPDSQAAVDAARQDAAAHLGVPADQLRVDDVQPRQWPDSSLGCPRPGNMYSQIVTPGFLITISTASGRQLEYHTDDRSRVVLCKES